MAKKEEQRAKNEAYMLAKAEEPQDRKKLTAADDHHTADADQRLFDVVIHIS